MRKTAVSVRQCWPGPRGVAGSGDCAGVPFHSVRIRPRDWGSPDAFSVKTTPSLWFANLIVGGFLCFFVLSCCRSARQKRCTRRQKKSLINHVFANTPCPTEMVVAFLAERTALLISSLPFENWCSSLEYFICNCFGVLNIAEYFKGLLSFTWLIKTQRTLSKLTMIPLPTR